MKGVQNTEPAKATHCNLCGKLLDSIDTRCNDFSICHDIGYGSHFDTYAVDLHMCVECFDKLVCICEINPLQETPHTIDQGDYSPDDIRNDVTEELITKIDCNNVKCHDCPCDGDCDECFDVMKCEGDGDDDSDFGYDESDDETDDELDKYIKETETEMKDRITEHYYKRLKKDGYPIENCNCSICDAIRGYEARHPDISKETHDKKSDKKVAKDDKKDHSPTYEFLKAEWDFWD